MALKHLLVYLDQTEEALVRLELAVDLAARHASHLDALYVAEWSRAQLDARKAAELGLVSAERVQSLDDNVEHAIDAAAERLRARLAQLNRERGVEGELRVVAGTASMIVPQVARYADLCILGRDEPRGQASVEYTFCEQMLFLTGRPVLFVPATPPPTLGRRIALAWNSSRPSARSLNDAMPLLERAERVSVLLINPSKFLDRSPDRPGEAMLAHLRRHGVAAEPVLVENVPSGAIADTLQAEALARGADLLVAGAFGNPRLWEKLMGGVTHDLIARMRLPILMSH
jgi:nucleotide-binding universal stress UspA family protein